MKKKWHFSTLSRSSLSNTLSQYLSLSPKSVDCWDARMRLPGQRTRVRRGGTRRHERDAADRESVPRRAAWRFPNRADAAEIGTDATKIGVDAAQIGPTRSVSAISACIGRVRPKFKKKKKKVQNAPFDLT